MNLSKINILFNKYIQILIALVIFSVCISPVFSQEKKSTKNSEKAQDKDLQGSYLDRHRAIKSAQHMQGQTIIDIRRLNILVANFGGKVDGASKDFEELKNTYKKAQVQWYRRHYLRSKQTHKQGRDMVFQLYKRFTTMYDIQTSKLLSDCSEALVNAEFSQSQKDGSEDSHSMQVHQSTYKMQTAFKQLQQASDLNKRRKFYSAIHHFRIAKLFAIEVLRSLELNTQKQKELDKKFATDIQDAKGYTASSTPAK